MIVVGFDPGSAHFARCVLDVTPTRATFVSCGVFEVGHIVKLARPRGRKDGRTQTEERIVDAGDVEQLATSVRSFLTSTWPGTDDWKPKQLCACERRPRVSPRDRGMLSAELASQLATAKELGGGAVEIARFIGYAIELVTPEEWRKALCGDYHADDKMVGAAIPLAITGWPKRSNPHERDAAGVALYGARKRMASRPTSPDERRARFDAEHDSRCTIRDGAGCSLESGCEAFKDLAKSLESPAIAGYDGEPDRSYPAFAGR